MKQIFAGILFLVFSTTFTMAQDSIKLIIQSLPPFHPSGSEIYMAGSFNGWNPADKNYKFKHSSKGSYSLSLLLPPGEYEYKLTRGGWDKAECKASGEALENRHLIIPGNVVGYNLSIEEWTDRFPAKARESTASKNVHIIDTAFFIPQLKRTRRVWIYLPEDYAYSKKHYPVLYMQDGQNVFDEATAYSGEWGVDEYLDALQDKQKECIVVAADHGGLKRMNEYNAYDNKQFGKGEGNAYAEFLVKTLKPFIDKQYRTMPSKEHTFIAGSSMGGLFSFYTILKYPEVYGGAGIFSPALWIAPGIYDYLNKQGRKLDAAIYFYGGTKEDAAMIPNIEKAASILEKMPASVTKISIGEGESHSETAWRKEFPLFYQWLMTMKSAANSSK